MVSLGKDILFQEGKNLVISSGLYTYIEYVIGANMYLVIFCVLSHNILSQSSSFFWKCYRNSRCRCCILFCPKFWVDYYMLIYVHHMQLMMSVGSYGSF